MLDNPFPPIESANEYGLLAQSDFITAELITCAYQEGIFPWPSEEYGPINWFAPDPRGIIEFNNFHVSKSLLKRIRKKNYKVGINLNFEKVIKLCAQSKNREDGQGTWITSSIIDSYIHLHEQQNAYSIELYNIKNTLVGGLYGVNIKSYLSGESMFYLEPNASKIALYYLYKLCTQNNMTWMDTQMITPIIKQFGGVNITRNIFMKLLKASILTPPHLEILTMKGHINEKGEVENVNSKSGTNG